MKQIDYNIPIFDDNDEADLNEYSNKMAQAIKEQVDKFGNPLIFKGTVTTSQELPSDAQSGWIYNVSDENKNYIYNGTEWVVYSENIDTTLFINQSTVYYDDLDNIKDKTSYYYTSASATNKPPQANGTNGYVFTQMVNDNVGYQTYKTTNAEYERFKNVTWGEWQEKEKKVTLYENATGSNSNITLNDDVSNYKYLEVFYRDSSNYYGSQKIENPNGKQFEVHTLWANVTETYNTVTIKHTLFRASSKTISYVRSSNITLRPDNSSMSQEMDLKQIFVTKVIGYK